MSKTKILLTDSQSVQAISVAKFLKKRGDVEIYGFFKNKINYTFYTNLFKKKIISPKTDSENFLLFLTNFLKSNKIDVVIPLNDASSEILSKNKDIVEKYSSILISDYENFLNGFDKSRLMELCSLIDVDHPFTVNLSSKNYKKLLKNLKFPLLLKPNNLTGSRGITRVNNYIELNTSLNNLGDEINNYHLQEYIFPNNIQIKAQLIVDYKTTLVASSVMLKKRFFPIQGGSSTFNLTIENHMVVASCYKVLKKLNWIGFADFDLISDKNGNFKIIEINPRIPACIKSALVSGINYPELILDLSLKRKVNPSTYLPGKAVKHIGLDFLWLLNANQKGKLYIYFKDFFDKNVYYQDYYSIIPFIIGTFGNIFNFLSIKFMNNKKW